MNHARDLRFEAIDLARHADLCVAFRNDSFICSFGTTQSFFDEAGPGGADYLASLSGAIETFPDGFVHVWCADEIVGQLEMRVLTQPERGYINLFYLRPESRGLGFGDALHHYALSFMRRHQMTTAQLSVSPTNARALAYYKKHGWRSLGPRPNHPHVTLMQLEIPSLQRS